MTIEQTILDVCCGSRMFFHDKQDVRVLFGDTRRESHTLCDGDVIVVARGFNFFAASVLGVILLA